MTIIKSVEVTTSPQTLTEVIVNFSTDARCMQGIEKVRGLQQQYNFVVERLIKDVTELKAITNIKKVIFNPPATIVFWKDGTKTVVKAQGKEKFDKEKGLAMALVKKTFGNKGNYNNLFKRWVDNDSD